MNMLLSSIPKSIRFEVKSKSQKYAHVAGFLTLSIFSFLAIEKYISFEQVWLVALAFSLSGIWIVRILLRKLNFFHITNIMDFKTCPFNVYEAINSCFALANKDATQYYSILSKIMENKENRPIFTKALVHAI